MNKQYTDWIAMAIGRPVCCNKQPVRIAKSMIIQDFVSYRMLGIPKQLIVGIVKANGLSRLQKQWIGRIEARGHRLQKQLLLKKWNFGVHKHGIWRDCRSK